MVRKGRVELKPQLEPHYQHHQNGSRRGDEVSGSLVSFERIHSHILTYRIICLTNESERVVSRPVILLSFFLSLVVIFSGHENVAQSFCSSVDRSIAFHSRFASVWGFSVHSSAAREPKSLSASHLF